MEGEKYIEVIRRRMREGRFIHSVNGAMEAVRVCDN